MFEEIKLAIALLGGIICGLYDLKTSNMLDPVAWAMITFGIGIHAYESWITGNWFILEWCLLIVAIFFLFSLFMYYRGYWGGGDGEMLIAYGALLPFGIDSSPLFSLMFFINVFVVGGLYSLLYAGVKVFQEKKLRKKLFTYLEEEKFEIFASVIFLLFSVYLYITKNILWNLFMVITLLFALKPLLLFGRFVEKNMFIKKIPVKNLREDDVLGESIPELGLEGKLIRGLKKEEIENIRKVRKYVKIREGVRFIPVFPLAILLTLTGFPLIV